MNYALPLLFNTLGLNQNAPSLSAAGPASSGTGFDVSNFANMFSNAASGNFSFEGVVGNLLNSFSQATGISFAGGPDLSTGVNGMLSFVRNFVPGLG